MRIIAIINQKGGVGKTTTVANLGAALARAGKRVVAVDLDPQANLSLYLGSEVDRDEPSIYGVLTETHALKNALRPTATPGLQLVASHIDLSGAELELAATMGREVLLRDAIEQWAAADANPNGPADFVLLDCPPSLGLLSVNALVAADEVMIAVQTEFFALQGLSKLVEVVELLQRRMNPNLELTGIIPCLYDSRLKLAREVLVELRRHFPGKVFQKPIRNNVRLAESPSFGQTIFEYAPDSNGAKDYAWLAEEILTRAGEAAQVPLGGTPAMDSCGGTPTRDSSVGTSTTDDFADTPTNEDRGETLSDDANSAGTGEREPIQEPPIANAAGSMDQPENPQTAPAPETGTDHRVEPTSVPIPRPIEDEVDAELAAYEIPRNGALAPNNHEHEPHLDAQGAVEAPDSWPPPEQSDPADAEPKTKQKDNHQINPVNAPGDTKTESGPIDFVGPSWVPAEGVAPLGSQMTEPTAGPSVAPPRPKIEINDVEEASPRQPEPEMDSDGKGLPDATPGAPEDIQGQEQDQEAVEASSTVATPTVAVPRIEDAPAETSGETAESPKKTPETDKPAPTRVYGFGDYLGEDRGGRIPGRNR